MGSRLVLKQLQSIALFLGFACFGAKHTISPANRARSRKYPATNQKNSEADKRATFLLQINWKNN